MNREQAENILDAYVLLSETKMEKASDSLREVILDAMTEWRSYPISISSQPVRMPTTTPYKPLVTWTSEVETGQMSEVGA